MYHLRVDFFVEIFSFLLTIAKFYDILYLEVIKLLPEGVTFKFDWLTLMVHNRSIESLFDFLIPDSDLDYAAVYEAIGKTYLRSLTGMGITACIEFPWFNLYIGQDQLPDVSDDSFFKFPWRKMRVDIAGQKLENLRAYTDIESVLFSQTLPDGFSISRLDCAFDYINYKPDILKKLQAFCVDHASDAGRIGCADRGSVKFEVRSGSIEALYLGSHGDILRVYDKRLEQFQKNMFDDEEPAPDSWIRLEWQLRNNALARMISQYSFISPESIFAGLFQHWSLRDQQAPGQPAPPVSDEWLELFEYDRTLEIIQNANSVKFEFDFSIEAVQDKISKHRTWLWQMISYFGKDGFISLLESDLEALRTSHTPTASLAYMRCINGIQKTAIASLNSSYDKMPFLGITSNGKHYIKD